MNIKLTEIRVSDPQKHPHMVRQAHHIASELLMISSQMAVKNCFIRGSVVRYVHLPPEHVDTAILQDATRREASTTRTIACGVLR